jgi:copper resistance protein B
MSTGLLIRSYGLSFPLMVLLTVPWTVAAQSAPASASSAAATSGAPMAGMDQVDMAGMPMPASSPQMGTPPADPPQTSSASKTPVSDAAAMKAIDHGTMKGQHADAKTGGMQNGAMQSMNHSSHAQDPMGGISGMSMDSMQGGSAPPGARSPDYSDGVGYGPMKADMSGDNAVGKLLIDQLEAFNGRDASGQSWELGGWYGTDANKVWVRSEGDRSAGKIQDGDVEVFWNHAIATYWGSQLGVRQDFGVGPGRIWAAFGVEGLAPYWFDLEATGYVGPSGRTAARLRVNYDVLFTQRLILTPELETNVYGKDDRARRIGSGLSDVQLSLRLRYEIRREFAPYIGLQWVRRFGQTADYVRADGERALDRQIVAGVRIWF